jgi:membrane protease subunit (stomatin/prohibitin family)/Zn-finger nucleic acid-binding protein
MSLTDFLSKQLIEVIQWNEPEEGILAWRYPVADMEIRNGAQLTVRESQMAAFVNEGRIADVFGPGLYTLNTRNLPLLTNLMNWDKGFESPFKSDVYFFSTRLQTDQHWGTANPITIREKEFGAVRLRAYGIYSYRIADPHVFFTNLSGTVDTYTVGDLEGQLRNTVVARLTDVVAPSEVAFLDMAANQAALAEKVAAVLQPSFAALGLWLVSFVIENLSLADELQKVLDQRIGVNMAGDLGKYTQFETAQSLPIAAANPGGAAGAGVGIGDYCRSVCFPEKNDDGVRLLGEHSSLLCPVCAVPLMHASLEHHRLLYCTRCRGTLITMAVFLLLIEDMRANRGGFDVILAPPERQELKRHIRCPQCGRAMDTHPYSGPGNVVIDDCSSCELNWLDAGELLKIARSPDYAKLYREDSYAQ